MQLQTGVWSMMFTLPIFVPSLLPKPKSTFWHEEEYARLHLALNPSILDFVSQLLKFLTASEISHSF